MDAIRIDNEKTKIRVRGLEFFYNNQRSLKSIDIDIAIVRDEFEYWCKKTTSWVYLTRYLSYFMILWGLCFSFVGVSWAGTFQTSLKRKCI